jgi:hypothetical protein
MQMMEFIREKAVGNEIKNFIAQKHLETISLEIFINP